MKWCFLWALGVLALAGGCASKPAATTSEGGAAEAAASAGQPQAQKGELLLEQGLTDSALEAFNAALAINPNLVRAHLGVGNVYRVKGDLERAQASYQKAVQLSPNSFESRYYLALSLQLQDQLDAAVAEYLRAVAIDPQSFEANRDLASAYLQMAKAAEALPYAKKAVELRPEDQPAWSNLAAAHSLLAQWREAVEAYRQAIELGQAFEPIALGLADAHLRMNNPALAINTLEALAQRRPSAVVYERLGFAHFKLRQFEAALANFRSALKLNADDTAALNGLGVSLMTLYVQSGRRPADHPMRIEALSAWRRSVDRDPDQPRIIDLIARYQ